LIIPLLPEQIFNRAAAPQRAECAANPSSATHLVAGSAACMLREKLIHSSAPHISLAHLKNYSKER
jgi:hypothetical protein